MRPRVKKFTTPGGGPSAVYSGNRYGGDITNGVPNLPSCGYDAAELQKAYGLPAAYSKGWNGAGQTIVIVDAFGSNTIVDDANAFSSLNGLPAAHPDTEFPDLYPQRPGELRDRLRKRKLAI